MPQFAQTLSFTSPHILNQVCSELKLYIHPLLPSTPQNVIWKACNLTLATIPLPFCWSLSQHGGSLKTKSDQERQLLFTGWAQIHLPWVYPSAAVKCVTAFPGVITVPLHTRFPQFITTIEACQLLLMIAAEPLPMKESIDWQRRLRCFGITHTLPVFFYFFARNPAAP